MKEFPKSLKRIGVWLFFFGISILLFMLMLGLIIRSDWMTNNSWFALLASALVVLIVILRFFIGWFIKWRHFRRTLFLLGCFVALVVLFYAEEDFRGWYAWHQFKQREEAKGEKFNYTNFVPPPVPDEQNFALTPIVASSYDWILDKSGKRLNPYKTNFVDRMFMEREIYGFVDTPTNYAAWAKAKVTDLKEWQNYYRALAAKTNYFPVSLMPQSSAADVLFALSKYDSTIEELRHSSQFPYSRFPLNYSADHPFETLLLHLAALKRCSLVLELRASAELENNQSDKALDDVKLMFRLINSIRSEPFLISHLVRIAMTSLTLQPVWEGLVKHKWSDAQIAELDREFTLLNFLNDYAFAMRYERAATIVEMDLLRQHRNYKEISDLFRTDYMLSDEHESFSFAEPSKISEILSCPVGLYLMPDGWYFENELTVAEMHRQCFLPMIDTNLQVALQKNRNDANEYFKKLNTGPWNIFASFFGDLGSSSGRKFSYAQNSINMARVASALERYRLAHNEYPETLDALAPQLIAQIPHDVIGGKPLHYRRTDGGKFLLYSIGWNETDDGGQIGLKETGYTDNTKGDWLWPNP